MGRARAMLIQAGIDSKGKGEFWCEVISTATKLDNIMVRPERAKPPHTLFYGKDAKYMKCMRTFGKMAVIAIHEGKKMRSKLDNRGKTCMFVGYAEDHAGDVYRFLNIHIEKNHHEQRCEMAEHNMETLQNEKPLCKKTVGTLPS